MEQHRQEFELPFSTVAVQQVSHNSMQTPPSNLRGRISDKIQSLLFTLLYFKVFSKKHQMLRNCLKEEQNMIYCFITKLSSTDDISQFPKGTHSYKSYHHNFSFQFTIVYSYAHYSCRTWRQHVGWLGSLVSGLRSYL